MVSTMHSTCVMCSLSSNLSVSGTRVRKLMIVRDESLAPLRARVFAISTTSAVRPHDSAKSVNFFKPGHSTTPDEFFSGLRAEMKSRFSHRDRTMV